jgi:hypothetical protein
MSSQLRYLMPPLNLPENALTKLNAGRWLPNFSFPSTHVLNLLFLSGRSMVLASWVIIIIIEEQVLQDFEEGREKDWPLSVLRSKARRHRKQQPPARLPQATIGGDLTTSVI